MSSRVLERADVTSVEADLIQALHRFSGADGDRIAGVLEDVCAGIAQARVVHPDFQGLPCVTREFADLVLADESGYRDSIRRQAHHLAVVAIRMCLMLEEDAHE